ncbi:glycosyltransferase family protein [Paenibacillus sp. ACRRX]|uniref:glycosyltransferase family protein n=1 Tax=Paenibacillus sp. ACRRX TaxID=2918206 RepID=UPI001EF51BD5|nr:glycosyltransferase family protein [Paenibacillus sp. ACRRX]MCG7410883.1 glycosyltransferase family protein [Paenibacillus sp. ACRRX]
MTAAERIENIMGLQRILFVICVNNDTLYEQTKRQVANLIVPPGHSVEIYEIRNADSMASGYNYAVHMDAAFKIYIHQDTFLIHRGMLVDLIQLFHHHPELGMVGLAGCVDMPANGIWWEGTKLAGQVIEHRQDTYQLLRFDHGWHESTDYIPVQGIDGLFMATKVDIPWRADLFNGFHFYDSSHSMEIQRAGYVVGVPVLQSPWCIHYNGDDFDQVTYEQYRKIFVQHYMS